MHLLLGSDVNKKRFFCLRWESEATKKDCIFQQANETKIGRGKITVKPFQKETMITIPTIHFRVRTVLVFLERVSNQFFPDGFGKI